MNKVKIHILINPHVMQLYKVVVMYCKVLIMKETGRR